MPPPTPAGKPPPGSVGGVLAGMNAAAAGGPTAVMNAIFRARNAADMARAPFEKLAKAMADPRVVKAAGAALEAENATRRLNAQTRARVELEARRAAVASGAYARDLAAQQKLAREAAKVADLERRAGLENRFGRVGGRLAYHAGNLAQSPAGQAAAATGMMGAGLARQGFSNTVEMNRFNLEVQLVSRELAGAMLPALRWATGAIQSVRKHLERLGPTAQDLLQAFMLAAGGFGAYRVGGMALGMVGLGGAAVGAAGAAAGAGAAGVAGGAAGAALPVAGSLAAGGGTAAAAKFGLRAVGRTALKALPGVGMAYTAYEGIGGGVEGYDESRRKGAGRGEAAAKGVANALANIVSFGMWNPYGRDKDAGPNPDRRKVTIADAGFDEVGSGMKRMTTSLALVDAAEADKKDPTLFELKGISEMLKEAMRSIGAGAGLGPK